MSYIVFDLEWNQPVENGHHNKRALAFEIIEIGAVKLNDKFEILGSFDEFIKPVVYKKLNWHTKSMLNVTMKDLEKGRMFSKVARDFLSWCGDAPVFCSWGNQDLTELQRNMAYYGMRPLSDSTIAFYDIQKIYSEYINEDRAYNLETAVDNLEIEKDTPFHRAYGDAYYTAKIMAKLLKNNKKLIKFGKTYDLYILPKNEKSIIYDFNGKCSYMLSCPYEDRDQLKANKKITGMTCPKCNNMPLRPKIRWFSSNNRNYYGAAVCLVHGPIKGLLRFKHNESCGYYLEKIMTYTDENGIEEIRNRKKNLSKKNKTEDNQNKK